MSENTRPNRPFIDVLREMERGRLLVALDEQLGELVRACDEFGKPGSLLLKIELKPGEHMDAPVVTAQASIDLKPPKPRRDGTLFFTDDFGNLSRRDPRQVDIEDGLTEIRGGKAAE